MIKERQNHVDSEVAGNSKQRLIYTPGDILGANIVPVR